MIYLPAIASGQETIDSILEKYPQYASELRPRLEAAIWLMNARKTVEPRQGFVPATRKAVEDRVDTLQPHGFWQRLFWRYTPQRWVFNIASPIIVLLLLALVINNLILTARLSIPGDLLYPTKLLVENIQLALTFDQVDKTDLYMQFSRERTTEFVELVLEGDYEQLPTAAARLETEIIASLHSMNEVPDHDPTVDPSVITNLRDTLSNEIFMLNVLKSSSPSKADPELILPFRSPSQGWLAYIDPFQL